MTKVDARHLVFWTSSLLCSRTATRPLHLESMVAAWLQSPAPAGSSSLEQSSPRIALARRVQPLQRPQRAGHTDDLVSDGDIRAVSSDVGGSAALRSCAEICCD
jgi:hypothetical protein